jgi:hypothetical protein
LSSDQILPFIAALEALLHPDIFPLGKPCNPGIFAGEGARATLCDIGYLLLEPGGGVWGLYLLDRLRVLGVGLVRIYGSNFG